MSGRTLTREQVLANNENWSYTDRETIAHHLDRLGARTFYVPPSGGYIGCVDDNGMRVLFIAAGFLTFRVGQAPEDRPNGWNRSIPLSTFRGHDSPNHEPEFKEVFCPIHNLSLPASGVCDLCFQD